MSIKSLIRTIPDYPKTGVQFRDITTLLQDQKGFREAVDGLCTKLLYTMPDCLTKTIESVRKHKLEHWDRNRETNRAWLALNMMTEANAGFRAFHHGSRDEREVDFVKLRQRLARGARWSEELIREIAPWIAGAVEKV